MCTLLLGSRQLNKFCADAPPSTLSSGAMSEYLHVDEFSEESYLQNIATAVKEAEMLTKQHVQKQIGIHDVVLCI